MNAKTKIVLLMGLVLGASYATAGVIVSKEPVFERGEWTNSIQSEKHSQRLKVEKVRVTPSFTMKEGEMISDALSRWAKQSGYKLIWDMPYTWKVMSDYAIKEKDVVKAVANVVEFLRKQGKPVKVTAYQNKIIVIGKDNSIPNLD